MLLGPYSLEIIVNGSSLPELNQPLRDLKVPVSTGPSYFLDEWTGQRYISDSITWAKVQYPGTHFAVRFSSSSVSPWFPLMAYLVIDGQLDYRYTEIYHTGFHSRDHFVSSDKSVKYFFKFKNTIWSDEGYDNVVDNHNTMYGGIGAISLYFYRARPINEKCNVMPHLDIKQLVLSEGRGTSDITISTGFDTTLNPLGAFTPNMNYLQSLYNIPVGVLHLHYRLVEIAMVPIHNLSWDDRGRVTCLHDFTCMRMVKVEQEFEDNEFSSVKQGPESEDDGFVSIKQEGHQDSGIAWVKREDEDSCQFFENIKQEIKEELCPPIKIETTDVDFKQRRKVTMSKNFKVCKKNENGKKRKKHGKKNSRRRKKIRKN